MKKWIAVFMAGLLTACASEKTEMTNEKTSEQQIDEIFAAFTGNNPGAAVMVIQDGKVTLQKGYGMARVADGTPVTPKSNFRLASVTKQFTAMSILQLVERGQLTLDTSLTDIFPEYPEHGKDITIRHMLQHSSGLKDYAPMSELGLDRQFTDQDVFDFMVTLDDVDFAVGEQHVYSNSAYVLFTKILEKITGEHWRDYVKANIFDPIGMDNTLAFVDGVNVVSNRAYGHTVAENGDITETDQNDWSAMLGDGGIYSSLEDFYKWDQALYTDKLLSQEMMDAMFVNRKTNDGTLMNYGYGWRLENYKGMDVHYHTGSSIGFRNIYYRIPEKNFSLLIFRNRDEGGEFSSLEYAHDMVDVFFK
ncbi:serine hydrolase domain-containing protein [Pseudemcibacter aquimaris]|uniref:serine hydrolase domain-containing protein n=1 Tax=Pseudemcibacter aquimaris TaxID=2857064 RepID=UPI002012FDB8|nr:serine hydrolase domain-containing protein [Pseudemcibacter aquimaris]MCC3861705.1 beta-lactamase family protein [Pseudemcibacter aquimaris]WDU58475.1 beta-lactamase family protein [Pseudemcibacter aquimaris]